MRLTLRTLLAWLDDMLPNQEVREIGQQVSESSFARELVERIRRVTRQRRLSVPVDDGQEVNDANRVAEYLDNVLSPEQVAESILRYHDLGVGSILIRGFEPLEDVREWGQDLIPLIREGAAARTSSRAADKAVGSAGVDRDVRDLETAPVLLTIMSVVKKHSTGFGPS